MYAAQIKLNKNVRQIYKKNFQTGEPGPDLSFTLTGLCQWPRIHGPGSRSDLNIARVSICANFAVSIHYRLVAWTQFHDHYFRQYALLDCLLPNNNNHSQAHCSSMSHQIYKMQI